MYIIHGWICLGLIINDEVLEYYVVYLNVGGDDIFLGGKLMGLVRIIKYLGMLLYQLE